MAGVGGLEVFISTVIQEQVRSPQVAGGQADVLATQLGQSQLHYSTSPHNVVIVRHIPHHVGVLPRQVQPHVRGQDLILLI